MLTRLIHNMRSNIAAYLALFISLGGSSWAAVNLPASSVGSRQLRNHAITPVKFDRRFINGNIRAWAVINPNGTVQESAGRPTVHVVKGVPNSYVITWKVAAPTQRSCFALGGLLGETGVGGSAAAALIAPSKRNWRVGVQTYGAQGQPLPQYFYVAMVC